MENRAERQKLFTELGLDQQGYPLEGVDLDSIDMAEYAEKLHKARMFEREQVAAREDAERDPS